MAYGSLLASKPKKYSDREVWFRALYKLNSHIESFHCSTAVDADGWCELVWECDEGADTIVEAGDMRDFLDRNGVPHEATGLGPEYWGYSEYTPEPGWVMRMKVNLENLGETASKALELSRELILQYDDLMNWRATAHAYEAELKMYAKKVCTFIEDGCEHRLCEFIRDAYMTSPELYDMKAGQFPRRPGSDFGAFFKARYPITKIEELCLKGPSFLFQPIKKEELDD